MGRALIAFVFAPTGEGAEPPPEKTEAEVAAEEQENIAADAVGDGSKYWADVARATIAAAEQRAADAERKTAEAEARAAEAEAAERRAARTWHEQSMPTEAAAPAGVERPEEVKSAGNKDRGSPVHRLLEAVYARKQAQASGASV